MKSMTLVAMLMILGLVVSCAAVAQEQPKASMEQTMKAPDVEKGKALFNDKKLGGGTTGLSCGSCHKGGSGLENAAGKTEFRIMGKPYKSLEAVINYFIETAQHGKALDVNSQEMKDLVAYVKSLGK